MAVPGLADLRILFVSFLAEALQFKQGSIFGRCLVDLLQVSSDGLVVLPRDVLQ